MRGTLLAVGLALLMVLPGAAWGAPEKAPPGTPEFEAQTLAELQALWARPSALPREEGARLLALAMQGEPLPDGARGELVRLARDLRGTAAARQLLEDALRQALEAAARSPPAARPVWQQDAWETWGAVLTGVYAGGGAATNNGMLLPHGLDVIGLHDRLQTDYGCRGGFFEGYCYFRATADLLGLVRVDMHETADLVAVQLPLSAQFEAHWKVSCGWSGCSFRFWTETHYPETLIATRAQYVFAVPTLSGQLATRATDSDLMMMAYDRLGRLDFQQARERTSASPFNTLPTDAQTEGTPGLGDVHASAPIPNYIGRQRAPENPDFPSALPGPAPQAAQHHYEPIGTMHVRVRDGFGTAPRDSEGMTVGYQLSQVLAWHLNMAFVRTKTTGLAMAPRPAPPASFYYDAAGYFEGPAGTIYLRDYDLSGPLYCPMPC